jgi:predicted nucleotidyltransferase
MGANHDFSLSEELAEAVRGIPAVEEVLCELRLRLLRRFGEELIGLYLYGSLVLGDFDPDRSDIDLLAAFRSAVGERELPMLETLHAEFARSYPAWDDRIEVAYVPTSGLRTFKSHASTLAIISPDEPLHLQEIGREGLIHYYLVRDHGIPLIGPPPQTLIDEISLDEFLDAVRAYLARWRKPMAPSATRGPQRYVVLTMCRGLYSLSHGRQTSKKHAALWAQNEFPEWAPIIERVLAAANDDPANEDDHEETAQFVDFALNLSQGHALHHEAHPRLSPHAKAEVDPGTFR